MAGGAEKTPGKERKQPVAKENFRTYEAQARLLAALFASHDIKINFEGKSSCVACSLQSSVHITKHVRSFSSRTLTSRWGHGGSGSERNLDG